MMVSIKVPPGSRFNVDLPKLFKELGFVFDAAIIGLSHPDGTTIEYAPCPADNGGEEHVPVT